MNFAAGESFPPRVLVNNLLSLPTRNGNYFSVLTSSLPETIPGMYGSKYAKYVEFLRICIAECWVPWLIGKVRVRKLAWAAMVYYIWKRNYRVFQGIQRRPSSLLENIYFDVRIRSSQFSSVSSMIMQPLARKMIFTLHFLLMTLLFLSICEIFVCVFPTKRQKKKEKGV